jgi:hypothetical protein
MKLTAFDRFIPRQLLGRLTLAALTLLPSYPIGAQTASATVTPATAPNSAPDPRNAEAQRRLMLSRRRRDEQSIESARYAQLLAASQQAPMTDATTHRRLHRQAAVHRTTTAGGRRAAKIPPAPAVNQ